MSYRALLSICVLTAITGAIALAQTAGVPFFDSTVVGYEAQVATGQTGLSLAVTPNVSADRKYVRMGIQATDSGPATFTPFQLTAPPGGSAVSAAPAPAPAPAGRQGGTSPGAKPVSVLDRVGMTFLSPLP